MRFIAKKTLRDFWEQYPDAQEPLIEKAKYEHFPNKKQLRLSSGTSCCKCDPALTELYEWLEK